MAISDKLTYLNTTKTKIREGLNSLGADLDTEDTFRSYADAIEGIYEDYPKITGEGESLSLDNTKQASMKIEYKGNTSQNGTPTPDSPIPVSVVSGDNEINVVGKNLIPTSDIISTSGTTSNGITFTRNSDGSITANGTATGAISIYINNDYTELSAGTYTFSDSVASGESGTTFFLYADVRHTDGTGWDYYNFSTANTTTGMTQTIPESFKFKTRIVIRNGQTLNNVVFKPMLEVGSSATTYEAYQGNTYNIDLPVENLFDDSTLNNKWVAQNGTITSAAGANCIKYNCSANDTYTLSATFGTSSANNIIVMAFYNSSDTLLNRYVTTTNTSLTMTYTAPANTSYMYAGHYGIVPTTIQLEKGSKQNNFTPYGTTPIELCKIGTYQDYIYKDNGVWYLHKEIEKIVFNGSENWSSSTNNRATTILPKTAGDGWSNVICKCNYLEAIYQSIAPTTTKENIICISGNNVYIRLTSNDDLSSIKTWLGVANPIAYYILATPTNTLIEDTTLIEQLEESKLSYISQTNISQVNNDLPFILDVKALRGE